MTNNSNTYQKTKSILFGIWLGLGLLLFILGLFFGLSAAFLSHEKLMAFMEWIKDSGALAVYGYSVIVFFTPLAILSPIAVILWFLWGAGIIDDPKGKISVLTFLIRR